MYRPTLSLRSILRLRSAILAEQTGRVTSGKTLRLRLRAPATEISLRLGTTDLYTFTDIFVAQVYKPVLLAGPIRTMIDLGANIGLTSLYVMGRFPRVQVFAVEPDATNFVQLAHNLRAGEQQVRLLRGAFWTHDGPVVFVPSEEPGHLTEGKIDGSSEERVPLRGVSVEGRTITSLLRQSGFTSVDVLKVDIEGAERHLFTGNLDWLKSVRCMLIEFHGNAREECGFDQLMATKGFTVSDAGQTTMALRNDQ